MRRPAHPAIDTVVLTTVLAALGDPVRLSVVRTLSDGEEHVQADFDVDVGQSTLSYHMRILREAGIAHSRPDGTRCFVSLRTDLDVRFPGLLTAVLGGTEAPPGRAGLSTTP